MVFGQEGAVVPLLPHRGQPQHRQTAHLPNGRLAERPRHRPRRQPQPRRDPPQVESGQYDVLPPPAAIPAARAGKRKRLVPPQQRHFAGKIHPPAEVNLTLFEHPGSPHFRFDGPPGPCSFGWTCFQLTALFRKLQPFSSAFLRRLTKLLDKLSKKR